MILHCRFDAAADAATNMYADDLLPEAMPEGGMAMRFYGWQETTLSLGAFQPFAELEGFPSLARLPVVRRPSGGGAILHGSDLTYAIAVPRTHPWGFTAARLYDAVHAVMVDLLRRWSLDARLVGGGEPAPGRNESFLCFDRRSPGDVVVGEHKVLGSAQRRHRAAVVQHGSLLLRRPVVWEDGGHPAPSIHHPGIEDCLGRGVDLPSLCRDWVAALSRLAGLEARWDDRPEAALRGDGFAAAADRYRDRAWTHRR